MTHEPDQLWEGVLLRADPDGTRHLSLFTEGGIVELLPNPEDLTRELGWYNLDWQPVPYPFSDDDEDELPAQ